MRHDGTKETSESAEHLWLLAVSPTLWTAHFLASYLTAAIWCAKAGREAGLSGVRVSVAVFTVLALGVILYTGWVGLRRHRYGESSATHGADTAADRHRFLGLATVLLSGLSAIGVVYVAMPAIVFAACY